MRAAPAFQISLHRFGVWRGAVMLLAALGLAAIAAWTIDRETVPAATAGGLVALLVGGLAVSLASVPAVGLRWDGVRWHLGPPGSTSDDAVPGELVVAIDLGPWMLLRFEPAAPPPAPRARWLPVQRRGLEAQWHALRCAVYSPRPAPGAGPDTGA